MHTCLLSTRCNSSVNLYLQGPLKAHKCTHAENEVQADDNDDDDADDNENDEHADDDDGDGQSGLHTCMSFTSKALLSCVLHVSAKKSCQGKIRSELHRSVLHQLNFATF